MKSLDTNILIRFIAEESTDQAEAAAAVMQQPCWIAATVLLETAWVLRSRLGLARLDLADLLADVIALPTVTVERADGMAWALERFRSGADLADMIHLACSDGANAFVTFDRAIARGAGVHAPVPVETLA